MSQYKFLEELDGMKNADLGTYCKNNGIAVNAKNISKPTKAEFISAIKASGKYEGSTGETLTETPDQVTESEVLDTTPVDDLQDESDVNDLLDVGEPKLSNIEKNKNAEKDKRISLARKKKMMMQLKRVTITMPNKTQTTVENQVHYVTWGNTEFGHMTDKFIVGSPWHVRLGALKNLEAATIGVSIRGEGGKGVRYKKVPKYNIQYLDPLSKEELALIAKRQVIRDSSIAE